MDESQIVELKRFAKQLEETGRGEETRAAARAILLLADEVESLTLALASDGEAEQVPVHTGDDGGDGGVSWFRRSFSSGAAGGNGDSAA